MSDEVTPVPAVQGMSKLDYSPIHKNISLAKIVELRNKKLTYQEIGQILGCTKENIYARLRVFKGSVDNLQSVKDNRADVYTVIGDGLLNSLTYEDIQKASAYQKVGMAGLLHNMERLERDKSTSNVVYVDLTREHGDLNAERVKLEGELGLGQDAGEVPEDDTPWTVDAEDSEAGDPQT